MLIGALLVYQLSQEFKKCKLRVYPSCVKIESCWYWNVNAGSGEHVVYLLFKK